MSDRACGEMREGSADEPASRPAPTTDPAVPGLFDRDGRMISYAQNGEDVLLRRALSHVSSGFYIDIGANHPVDLSVTRHFSLSGWRGINVEPNSRLHRELQADRPRDIQLNVGLASRSGELTFFECPDQPALSTFSAVEAAEHRARGFAMQESRVPVCTLAEICERHVTGTIDFLSVDVEGFEGEVLAGGDFRKWRPRIVVVEATRPMTATPSHSNWESLLTEQDYLFAFFDGLNRYYVRGEDADLRERFSMPVCVVDRYIPYAHWREREELGAALRQKQAALMEALLAREQADGQLRAKHADLHQALSKLGDLHRHLQSLRGEVDRATEQNRQYQNQLQATHEALQAAHQAMHALHEALQSKHEALLAALRQGQDLNAQLMEKHTALLAALQQGQDLNAQLLEKDAALLSAIRLGEALQVQVLEKDQALQEWQNRQESVELCTPAIAEEDLPAPRENAA